MAIVNDKLNKAFSIPIIFFQITFTLDFINSMCYTFLSKFDIGNIIYVVFFVLFFLYISYICDEIDQTLQRIAHRFSKSQNNNKIFRHVHYDHVNINQSTMFKCRQSAVIRLREIKIYRPYFGLWMFNLCCIDLTFVFSFSLFVINYVVLITQTQ